MSNIDKIIKMAVEGIATYRRAITKKYENISHVMREDYEVLIPSDTESYTFDKKVWNILDNKDYVVITKKV